CVSPDWKRRINGQNCSWPAKHRSMTCCAPMLTMLLFRYRRHRSALTDRPSSQFGSYTTPKSNDLPDSGPIGKPANAEPDAIALSCELFCTAVLRNGPVVGTPTQPGWPAIGLVPVPE